MGQELAKVLPQEEIDEEEAIVFEKYGNFMRFVATDIIPFLETSYSPSDPMKNVVEDLKIFASYPTKTTYPIFFDSVIVTLHSIVGMKGLCTKTLHLLGANTALKDALTQAHIDKKVDRKLVEHLSQPDSFKELHAVLKLLQLKMNEYLKKKQEENPGKSSLISIFFGNQPSIELFQNAIIRLKKFSIVNGSENELIAIETEEWQEHFRPAYVFLVLLRYITFFVDSTDI